MSNKISKSKFKKRNLKLEVYYLDFYWELRFRN